MFSEASIIVLGLSTHKPVFMIPETCPWVLDPSLEYTGSRPTLACDAKDAWHVRFIAARLLCHH